MVQASMRAGDTDAVRLPLAHTRPSARAPFTGLPAGPLPQVKRAQG